MTTINTQENTYSFEDALARHIETLVSDADVQYDGWGEYTVDKPGEDWFRVQVCPTSEIPADTLVGGLFIMENDAPTVNVDGAEYTIIRQW